MSRLALNLVAPVLRLASPGWWRGLREYHAYHGVWSLGVRLLRRWSIKAKVLTLLVIVALPLAPTTAYLLHDLEQTVRNAGRQLAAVTLADAASSLGTELNLQVQSLQGGGSVDFERSAALHRSLAAAIEHWSAKGAALPDNWSQDERAIARAVDERGLNLPARERAVQAATAALRGLRNAAVTSGAATLSADQAVNRSAMLAVRLVPDLQVNVGALRNLAARQSHLRGAEPRPTVALHELVVEGAGRAALSQHLAEAIDAELAWLVLHGGAPVRTLERTSALLSGFKARMLIGDNADDGKVLLDTATAARSELAALRSELVADTLQRLRDELEVAEQTQWRAICLLALCLLAAAYLGYTFFLVMRGGLKALNHQMDRMARGDLSARPLPHGGDEVAEAMLSMTASLARLSDLLASVRHGIGAVTQAATQVGLGNGALAERNREAAGRLEDVVSSVLRYTQQLEACGREVEGVVAVVQELRLDAMRNRKQTERLKEQMSSLRTRSREIGDIVRLIDGIAFRTNILSLNAQVEASKAGEAGRGFAVVAQEVRSLALRSAQSARRIDEIVTRSTDEIERSGALVEETGRALAAVDGHVDRIHAAMQGVAELTRSGTSESVSILAEVKQLESGSVRNQELVDQLASAAESLRQQGGKLSQGIAQFTLA